MKKKVNYFFSLLLVVGTILNSTVMLNAEPYRSDVESSVEDGNTIFSESQLSAESKSTESNGVQPQTDYKANSWRYKDGEPREDLWEVQSGTYENAWGYENGNWVNSMGDPIEGAVAKGIDVSSFNGAIDWETVKNRSDVDYAIIRCGYGNDFTDQDDSRWEYNASECQRLDIPFGVYIYSYALNTDEALSEAEHVLRLISGYDLSLPIYLDLEDEKYTGQLTEQEIGDIAEVFCDRIREAGYEVGIYANLNWHRTRLTDSRFELWEKWVAQYNYQCDYDGEYGMWQCTSVGNVPGIEGNVDLDFDFIDRGYKTDNLKPVQGLSALPTGNANIYLSWRSVENAEGYIIYRRTETEETFSYRYIVNKTNFTDTTALKNANNYYRVYPYYTDQDGDMITGPCLEDVCAKAEAKTITGLSAESLGKYKVKLVWDYAEGADGYFIYKSIGGGAFSYLYMKNTNSYVDLNASGKEYNFYRVYPYYLSATGEKVIGASQSYVFAKGLPKPVTDLKASAGVKSVTITWKEEQDADGYIIYRQVGDDGKFVYRYIVQNPGFRDTTASTEVWNYYRVYPYYIEDGERITNTQSIMYTYGRAR